MTRDIVSLFPHGSYPWAVACRGDGRFLAVGSYSRTVTIWDLANRRQARLLTDHPGAVDAVMWSPDGTSILTSSQGSSWLWSFATAKQLREFPTPAIPVAWRGDVILTMTVKRAVTVDADGELLVSRSDDRTVRIWDVATGRQTGFQIDSLAEDHWVVRSPEGTIRHASPGAHRWLAVQCVVDGDTVLLPVTPSDLPA